MSKHQILLFALAISFGCGAATTFYAHATEETSNGEITVTNSEDPTEGETEVYVEAGETTNPNARATDSEETDGDCDEEMDCIEGVIYGDELQNALDEGLADEPEVICASEDEEDCETESDPEMWPMYVSLGALAATFVLVIIINFASPKKS